MKRFELMIEDIMEKYNIEEEYNKFVDTIKREQNDHTRRI